MLNGSNRGCNFPSFLPSVPSEQIDVDSVPPRLILLVARSLTYVQYADYPPDYDSPPLSSDRLFNHSARVSPPAAFPSSSTPFHRSRFRIRRRWWVAIVHGHLDTRVVLVISLNIYIYILALGQTSHCLVIAGSEPRFQDVVARGEAR